MIFQHTLPLILSGDKSQTRRVIHENEQALRGRFNRIEAVFHNEREKWRVGNIYAVQPGRGQSQVARIRISAINSEKLSRISTSSAIAEGFSDRKDFLNTWIKIHGSDSLDVRVWVITFELHSLLIPDMRPVVFSTKSQIYVHGEHVHASQ